MSAIRTGSRLPFKGPRSRWAHDHHAGAGKRRLHQLLPRLEEVGEHVYAYVQPDGGWCLNNAGVITVGRETALVDTAATERHARALREAVLGVGAVPRVVVNTHSHGDHTFGNFVFPEALVVGHAGTRTEMQQVGLHLTGLWPDVDWGTSSWYRRR